MTLIAKLLSNFMRVISTAPSDFKLGLRVRELLRTCFVVDYFMCFIKFVIHKLP